MRKTVLTSAPLRADLSYPGQEVTESKSVIDSAFEIFVVACPNIKPEFIHCCFLLLSCVCTCALVWICTSEAALRMCSSVAIQTASSMAAMAADRCSSAHVLMDVLLFCLCIEFHGHLRSSVAVLKPVF